MGNAESAVMRLVGALAEPCTQCWHDVSQNDVLCDSNCGETCCKCHIESHHPDDSDEADED